MDLVEALRALISAIAKPLLALLSMKHERKLDKATQTAFDLKFDTLAKRMQSEQAGAGLSAAFRATPDELRMAALEAMKTKPPTLPAENQAGAVCSTAINILTHWHVSDAEAETLLGLPVGQLANWKTDPPALSSLSLDAVYRISYILGIFAALQVLFTDQELADSWIYRHNSDPVFGGQRPLDRLLQGKHEDLRAVRVFLDGWRQ